MMFLRHFAGGLTYFMIVAYLIALCLMGVFIFKRANLLES